MAYMNQPGSGNEFVFTNEWSHGLCGFCDDVKMCCCVFWCPCLSCCAIDKALGNFEYCKLIQCLLNVLCGVPPVFLTADFTASRALIRGAYKIQGSTCGDAFVTSCCQPCAQCQMHKELQEHGLANF